MKFYAIKLFLFSILFSVSILGFCQIDTVKTIGTTIDGSRIAWDYSSINCISPKGWYVRMKRLSNNYLIAVYDDQLGNSSFKRSIDNGKTWSSVRYLFNSYTQNNVYVISANPEICQLSNGDLIAACNNRPAVDNILPYSISVRRSTDMGQTWSSPIIIFEGEPRFNDGCWEPTFLELPDGTLQLYFTDEGRFKTTAEQETRMLTSHDGGNTWDAEIKNVSYRAGSRDGMPVGVISDDEIIVSIESFEPGNPLRPNILRTKINNPWPNQLTASAPERTNSGIIFQNGVRGAGPYIVKIPSGEILLSYQTNRNRPDMQHEVVEVAIGDKSASNFGKITQPFNLPPTKSATWNSLMLWDSTSVAVVSSVDYNSTTVGAWYQIGHIISKNVLPTGNPVIDGTLSQNEWKVSSQLFVGSKTNSNLKCNLLAGNNSLNIAIQVVDDTLFSSTNVSDGVNIYLDPQNKCFTSISQFQYKIWCSVNGEVILYQGLNGKWLKTQQTEIHSAITQNSTNDGYTIELSIPKTAINGLNSNVFRINTELVDYTSDTKGYSESLVHADATKPNTWFEMYYTEPKAKTIFVSTSGNDNTGDGSSQKPFNTINKALEMVSFPNDTVKILKGTYQVTSTLNLKPYSQIICGESALNTSLDFTGLANAINIDKYNISILFKDLTLQNAGNQFDAGGGLMWINASNSLSLENLIVKNNSANNTGGAICFYGKNLKINNCLFENNKVNKKTYAYGGALFIQGIDGYTDVKISNSTFYKNSSDVFGGAITFWKTSGSKDNIILTNNVFFENKALDVANNWTSGAVNFQSVSNSKINAILANNTFYNNTSGNGSYITSLLAQGPKTYLTLVNNVITNKSGDGVSFYVLDGSAPYTNGKNNIIRTIGPEMINQPFFSNQDNRNFYSISNSVVEGVKLSDNLLNKSINGVYNTPFIASLEASTTIDNGLNTYLNPNIVPKFDFIGQAINRTKDIGAYEYYDITKLGNVIQKNSYSIFVRNQVVTINLLYSKKRNISIFNTLGKLIETNQTTNDNVSFLINHKGLYIILIDEDGVTGFQKIIVQ